MRETARVGVLGVPREDRKSDSDRASDKTRDEKIVLLDQESLDRLREQGQELWEQVHERLEAQRTIADKDLRLVVR